MAFNVGGLTKWVNDNSQELITAAVLEAETAKYITVIPGIKYKQRLKFLATSAPFIAGGCGWSSTGTTTLTEKDLLVTSLRTTEVLCPDDLEQYSLQLSMKAGKNTAIPFEQLYAQTKVQQIQKNLEMMIWANDAADTIHFEGFTHMMNADSDVVDKSFNWSGTTFTASDYTTAIFAAYNGLPAEVRNADDLKLFIGHDAYARLVNAYFIANLYHVDVTAQDGKSTFKFPGIANLEIVPVNGLNGTRYGIMTPAGNLIYAVDLMNGDEKIESWYSQDNQEVRTVANFKAGVSYYYGTYIVLQQ